MDSQTWNDDFSSQMTDVVRRVWEFNKPEDFEGWNATGSGTVFPVTPVSSQSGQLQLQLTATSGEGFTAYADPASVVLGLNTRARLKFLMSLSPALAVDFAFGLGSGEHGWLGGSKYFKNGLILRKDTGDYNLDMLCARDNASSTNPIETADKTDIVRLMGTGLAVWCIDITTDPNVLGVGSARFFVNGKIFHRQQLTKIPYGCALTPTFGMFNREAASKLLTIDRIELEHGRYTTTTLSAISSGTSSGSSGDGGGGSGGSTGGSDCIASGTLVTMADGSKRPVEQLAIGDSLMGMNSPIRLEAIREVGVREVVEVSTFMGDKVICTADHPFISHGEQLKAIDLVVETDAGTDCKEMESDTGLTVASRVTPAGEACVFALTVEGGLFWANGLLCHNKDTGVGPATPAPGVYPATVSY